MDPRTLFHFCPRCGKPSLTLDQKHAIRCRACGFLFFFNAATAVGAFIPDPQGRLLFLRRAKDPARGKLGIPGGFLDPGEAVEPALIREVHEEVNLQVNQMRYLCSGPNAYLYQGVTYLTADLYFICTVHDFSPLQAREEVASYEFLLPNQVNLDEIAFPSMRFAMGEYRKQLSRAG